MNVLVTGGTGFIGRFLVAELRRQGATIHVLTRRESKARFEALRAATDSLGGKLLPLWGDISKPKVIAPADLKKLTGKIDHLFHLAAIYDLAMDEATAQTHNVDGTRHVIRLANTLGGKLRLHHISSIAIAGDAKGSFREDMFDVGQRHSHPYHRSKFEAEAAVRAEATVPWRVYRPGIVVGSSQTGEMDKIDGPYYFFKLIQSLRRLLPPWIPLVVPDGGKMQFAPVDYVAAAIAAIALKPGLDGRAFHLLSDQVLSIGDTANIFCHAAHAPALALRIDTRTLKIVPSGIRSLAANLPIVNELKKQLAGGLGVPPEILNQSSLLRAEFDTRDAARALAGSGIACPPLDTYAWRLWDYWERHMDPDLHKARNLEGVVGGRVVMVTGASSGIGREVAIAVGKAGAVTLLVARSQDGLADVAAEIANLGGTAFIYACDLSHMDSIDALLRQVIAEHGGVDVLINNAGRSIRRTVAESYDRFHDFERTMQLNYFGALRLILGVLPGMRARRSGHIVNISSMGVQTNAPRFSAYIASKSALDAFSRCIAAEVFADGIQVTTVMMPLVRTPMIAPTKIYDHFPALSPQEACDLVVDAMIRRPKRVTTRLGTFVEVSYALAPKFVDFVQSIGYRLFPASKPGQTQEVTVEGVAFAHLMRGIHW